MANKKKKSIRERRKRTLAQVTIEMAMPRTAASVRAITKAAEKTKQDRATFVENLDTSSFVTASRNQPAYAV
jgi:hypothetical protein